jgi:hypothetical protein
LGSVESDYYYFFVEKVKIFPTDSNRSGFTNNETIAGAVRGTNIAASGAVFVLPVTKVAGF